MVVIGVYTREEIVNPHPVAKRIGRMSPNKDESTQGTEMTSVSGGGSSSRAAWTTPEDHYTAHSDASQAADDLGHSIENAEAGQMSQGAIDDFKERQEEERRRKEELEGEIPSLKKN
ncbi:hypothetical protein L198_04820 [Cryptococcus wingfieldii CBS 7118]|uniref:Uncharacterized protein n=1 Tax=Cryptococcus wingfieldii CBS 7118 TaxID=1295528 RepID=A0A1E3J1F5_9TREE|nr:hypothetical protein L198_04820 [Cryptococcus wingfieldii CBS 7118]ODN94679.1 hypothetical protein L198_04820 [Cryptococcus wingfieldii CBS 7118]